MLLSIPRHRVSSVLGFLWPDKPLCPPTQQRLPSPMTGIQQRPEHEHDFSDSVQMSKQHSQELLEIFHQELYKHVNIDLHNYVQPLVLN